MVWKLVAAIFEKYHLLQPMIENHEYSFSASLLKHLPLSSLFDHGLLLQLCPGSRGQDLRYGVWKAGAL